MPHIIIEHSLDISKEPIITLQKNIRDSFKALPDYSDFDQCKFRSLGFEQYLVGKLDQEMSSFIHVTAKILEGRPEEIRKNLSDKIFYNIQTSFKLISKKARLDISVEIFEMNASTYNGIIKKMGGFFDPFNQ